MFSHWLVTNTTPRCKVKSVTTSKMASGNKRPRRYFSPEEVAEICTRSDEESGSDIDSTTGGISSEEEDELHQQLQSASDW